MKRAKIVITGGPSGGKTTLIEGLKKELGQQVAVVPEAASVLYRGGFPRARSTDGRIAVQRAIYFTQRELETLIGGESPRASALVCDRGSLDAVAYWPKPERGFFTSVKSTRAAELKRYDWVLHLDTATEEFYETTNPLRTESFSEASALNERVKAAWRGHPRRFVITQNEDFLSKMTVSLAVVRAILEGHDADDIRRALNLP